MKKFILTLLSLAIPIIIIFCLFAVFVLIPFDEVIEGSKVDEKVFMGAVAGALLFSEVILLKYLQKK